MLKNLFAGAGYPLRALAVLMRTPQLWGYVAVPILVNLIVGAVLYLGLLFAGLRSIDVFVAALPSWAQALGSLLRVLLIVGLLLFLGFVLVRFGVVLGAPWYARLSEELEQRCTGQLIAPDHAGFGAAVRDIGRSLLYELKKLLFVIAVGGLLLLLAFVPIVGALLAGAGWLTLGVTIACLDFLDAPLERRRMRFRDKLGALRCSLPASAGFGLVSLGLSSIPFLNLLAIPLCVAAGTLFFCARLRDDR